MTNFNDLSKKPSRFLSFTGLLVPEFLSLLPYFADKFQQHMEIFTLEGKKRRNRRYVEYKTANLPTIENKLLFILTYLKGNDLQERSAEMFGLTQPKANRWIHLLHSVLNQTLDEIEVLPARDADSLAQMLDKLAIDPANTEAEVDATFDLNAETLETFVEDCDPEVGADIFVPFVEDCDPEVEADILEPFVEDCDPEVEADVFEPFVEDCDPEVEADIFEPFVEDCDPEVEADIFEPFVEDEAIELENEILETTSEVETMVEIDLYLHDGFERPINRPLNEEIPKIFYSGKRKQHTLKNVLLTDVSCHVLFLSDTFQSKNTIKKSQTKRVITYLKEVILVKTLVFKDLKYLSLIKFNLKRSLKVAS